MDQLGLAALLQKGEFLFRKARFQDYFRQQGHELGKIFGQAFQRYQGVVPGPMGLEHCTPAFSGQGQFQLVLVFGSQGQAFRQTVGSPAFARGVGLGPAFGHIRDTHPGGAGILHPHDFHLVGEIMGIYFRQKVIFFRHDLLFTLSLSASCPLLILPLINRPQGGIFLGGYRFDHNHGAIVLTKIGLGRLLNLFRGHLFIAGQ